MTVDLGGLPLELLLAIDVLEAPAFGAVGVDLGILSTLMVSGTATLEVKLGFGSSGSSPLTTIEFSTCARSQNRISCLILR